MKTRVYVALTSALLCFSLAGPSFAQNQPISNDIRRQNYEDSKNRLKVDRPDFTALEELGFPITKNFIITPSLNAHSGYDTNYDNLFSEQGSAFSGVDASVVLGFVKPNAATTLALKGSIYEVFEADRPERWDAGVSLDTYRALGNGVEVSAGAFYLRDASSFTENHSAAVYGKADYKNSNIEAYVGSVGYLVEYLSQPFSTTSLQSPFNVLNLNSEFNSRYFEQRAGLLVGRNRFIGAYIEGGYSAIDFTNQKLAALVDRDGDDYNATVGTRLTFASNLRADIGYRFNYRDLDDTTIDDYQTSFLDARVEWLPLSNFRLTFQVDRKLANPSSAFSRLSNSTTFATSLTYQATSRLAFALQAYQKRDKQIGDAVSYRERRLFAEATYSLNNKSQLYLSGILGHVKDEISQSSYDRLGISFGLRSKFNATETLPWQSLLDDLKTMPLENRLLSVRPGYSHLHLPKTRMITLTDPFLTQATGRLTDHDGQLDGYKLQFDIGSIDGKNPYGIYQTPVALRGFYGHYEDIDKSTCDFTLAFDCLFINITDTNTLSDNNTGPFGRLLARTTRKVHHWGVAVEAPIFVRNTPLTFDLKGSMAALENPSNFKFGLAVKAIQQRNNLFAIDTSVPDPVDYDEDLDTFYYGGYLGYRREFLLRKGLTLNVNADAGLYYADSDYQGQYIAFVPIGGSAFILDSGSANFNQQREAFIGSLQLDLSKDIGWGNIGVFGQAEYYSYVPRVSYNNNDQAGGGVFDIVGSQDGTTLVGDDAYSFTVGGRLSIPLSHGN